MPKWDSYTIDIDQEKNCYSCRGFKHLARNCRNSKIRERKRRLEYRNERNNLNEKESLIVLE